MRACFLGQNVCALGYGVATLQSPPLIQDEQTGDTPADPFGRRDIPRPLLAPPAPATTTLKKPARM
jgi:hypothetical protein